MEIVTNHNLQRIEAGCARIVRVLSGCESTLATDWVLPLTRREPEDALYYGLLQTGVDLKTMARIGDCDAPGMIVGAVYSGHRAAIALDTTPTPIKRERH